MVVRTNKFSNDSLIYCSYNFVNYQINRMKIGKILYWIFVIFVVYLIIEIIRKILGGSWEIEELIITMLAANLGYSFYLGSKLSEHIGWHKGKDH